VCLSGGKIFQKISWKNFFKTLLFGSQNPYRKKANLRGGLRKIDG